MNLGTAKPSNITIRADLPRQMPDGRDFMGVRLGDPGTEDLNVSGSFTAVNALRDWFRNNTMEQFSRNAVTGENNLDQTGYFCPGTSTCFGTVQAPGVQSACTNWSYTLDLLNPRSDGWTVFDANVTYNSGSSPTQPYLILTALYLLNATSSCIGTIIVEKCNVWTAVVAYPFILRNHTWSLNLADTELAPAVANYTTPGDALIVPQDQGLGPLLGVNHQIGNAFTSRASYTYPEGITTNWVAELFYIGDPNPLNCSCVDRFIRPTDYLLGAMQNFMFRVAFAANDTYRQTITGTEIDPTTVYQHDYQFLAAALVAVFTGLLSAMTLFWGFWDLDRKVTLSPLEIAGAVGASIVSGARGRVEAMLNEVGDVTVRCIDGRIVRVEANGEIEMENSDPSELPAVNIG